MPSRSSSMTTPPLLRRHHELQLQGPRPAPLKVSATTADDLLVANAKKRRPAPRQPVIIYVDSPKVVHAHPGEFKSVVQRLTGAPPSSMLLSASAPPPPPLQHFPFQFPSVGLGLGVRTLTTAADAPPASSCSQLPPAAGHEHGPGGGGTSLAGLMISPGGYGYQRSQSMTTVAANHLLATMVSSDDDPFLPPSLAACYTYTSSIPC